MRYEQPVNGKPFDISKIIIPEDTWAAGSGGFERGGRFYLPKETFYSGNDGISEWVCGPICVYLPLRQFGYDVSVKDVAQVLKANGATEDIGSPNWVLEQSFAHYEVETVRLHIKSPQELGEYFQDGWLSVINLWEVHEGSLFDQDRTGDGHLVVGMATNERNDILVADPSFRPQNDGLEPSFGFVTMTSNGLRIRHFDFSCGCEGYDAKCDHDYYRFWVDDRHTLINDEAFWESGAVILVRPEKIGRKVEEIKRFHERLRVT